MDIIIHIYIYISYNHKNVIKNEFKQWTNRSLAAPITSSIRPEGHRVAPTVIGPQPLLVLWISPGGVVDESQAVFGGEERKVLEITNHSKTLGGRTTWAYNFSGKIWDYWKLIIVNIYWFMIMIDLLTGYGSIPINTIFSGMNIHKSQLFWCELQGCKVLTHPHLWLVHLKFYHDGFWGIYQPLE